MHTLLNKDRDEPLIKMVWDLALRQGQDLNALAGGARWVWDMPAHEEDPYREPWQVDANINSCMVFRGGFKVADFNRTGGWFEDDSEVWFVRAARVALRA